MLRRTGIALTSLACISLAAPSFSSPADAAGAQAAQSSVVTVPVWRPTTTTVKKPPKTTVPKTKTTVPKTRKKKVKRTKRQSQLLQNTAVLAEAISYPLTVPDRTTPQWKVPVGAYVRGSDVYPLAEKLPYVTKAGCDQAKTVPQGVVVLSFGKQIKGGTNGFGTPIAYQDILEVTRAFTAGILSCATGPWEVAIGTSNSGGVTAYNGLSGGARWAQLVSDAKIVAGPLVSGAVDIEPGWGPPGQARAWVDGFVRAAPQTRLWNFGSADGCPQTVSSDLTCNNGWTIDDVLWVSSHAGPNVVAMPQIHTQSGSQARQWARLAARALGMQQGLRLSSFTVQTSACRQVKKGCPKTGVSAWDGYMQLRAYLDASALTEGYPLGTPMDIRGGFGPAGTPPPTTTTTTTTLPCVSTTVPVTTTTVKAVTTTTTLKPATTTSTSTTTTSSTTVAPGTTTVAPATTVPPSTTVAPPTTVKTNYCAPATTTTVKAVTTTTMKR
jgi:hypothetical protein